MTGPIFFLIIFMIVFMIVFLIFFVIAFMIVVTLSANKGTVSLSVCNGITVSGNIITRFRDCVGRRH